MIYKNILDENGFWTINPEMAISQSGVQREQGGPTENSIRFRNFLCRLKTLELNRFWFESDFLTIWLPNFEHSHYFLESEVISDIG